ncbi:mannose-6-phosphate isomerase, class I [Vibrio ulleungensis]|uniref:mannose-6-phosphate isomerase n=1 Tax=Vibrio ulleungensis TaxID=2807619 RepID=A0ABS2HHA9_9VIBR|nr:mannose-6-phosphate isomerase, class I [Vibrio ulleungensis]MBM7036933.1 mannose-6-phosphate isomerase, class I [Vibrio ulleungensis]
MSLFKLDNVIQNYAWGSIDSIQTLFGIANPNNQPQAEIWMGAHPNGCSKLSESGELLSHLIDDNKTEVLGEYTAARFGELPFLFKVLAAQTPLSIQVHPNKQNSELGFERENAQGIALNASNRNYKDPNHKPELVYALTFYKAMNGFRPIDDIIALFEENQIPSLASALSTLKTHADSNALKAFFTTIMSLEGEGKNRALEELYAAFEKPAKTAMGREAMQYSMDFKKHYPGDIGLFAPFMLNTVELAPGEAMFLFAETPHAYVQGTGLEIMANSDNVLRAGLTPKHIDVKELIDNTIFEPINPEDIRLQPVLKEGKKSYPIPVDDFGFDILSATQESKAQYMRSAEILFCVDGEVTITAGDKSIILTAGESVFISNHLGKYHYKGNGTVARAYN